VSKLYPPMKGLEGNWKPFSCLSCWASASVDAWVSLYYCDRCWLRIHCTGSRSELRPKHKGPRPLPHVSYSNMRRLR
jgi:hypothetical protein